VVAWCIPAVRHLETLDLSGHAISKLQGVSHLSKLTTLLLSGNAIGPKLTGLEALSSLRELDLSHNRLFSIDGVGTLSALEDLNLSGNIIQEIPSNISNIKGLRVLRVTGNRILQLADFAALAPLSMLQTLELKGNPATAADNSAAYIASILRSLITLDGEVVTEEFRVDAIKQLETGGDNTSKIAALQRDLDERNKELRAAQDMLVVTKTTSDGLVAKLGAAEENSSTAQQTLVACEGDLLRTTRELGLAHKRILDLEVALEEGVAAAAERAGRDKVSESAVAAATVRVNAAEQALESATERVIDLNRENAELRAGSCARAEAADAHDALQSQLQGEIDHLNALLIDAQHVSTSSCAPVEPCSPTPNLAPVAFAHVVGATVVDDCVEEGSDQDNAVDSIDVASEFLTPLAASRSNISDVQSYSVDTAEEDGSIIEVDSSLETIGAATDEEMALGMEMMMGMLDVQFAELSMLRGELETAQASVGHAASSPDITQGLADSRDESRVATCDAAVQADAVIDDTRDQEALIGEQHPQPDLLGQAGFETEPENPLTAKYDVYKAAVARQSNLTQQAADLVQTANSQLFQFQGSIRARTDQFERDVTRARTMRAKLSAPLAAFADLASTVVDRDAATMLQVLLSAHDTSAVAEDVLRSDQDRATISTSFPTPNHLGLGGKSSQYFAFDTVTKENSAEEAEIAGWGAAQHNAAMELEVLLQLRGGLDLTELIATTRSDGGSASVESLPCHDVTTTAGEGVCLTRDAITGVSGERELFSSASALNDAGLAVLTTTATVVKSLTEAGTQTVHIATSTSNDDLYVMALTENFKERHQAPEAAGLGALTVECITRDLTEEELSVSVSEAREVLPDQPVIAAECESLQWLRECQKLRAEMSVMKELNDGRRGELEMSEDNHASAIAAATEEVATLRASADRLRASLREAEAAVASAKADATTARANAAAAFDNAEAIRARAAHVESEGSKARHDIDVATSAEAGWYTKSMRLHMLCPKPPNLLSPF